MIVNFAQPSDMHRRAERDRAPGYKLDFFRMVPTWKYLFLLIGAQGFMTIKSPTVHVPSGSCAKYFFVTRIRLLYSGCGLKRSTSMTAVLSIRVDTTLPCSFCAAWMGCVQRAHRTTSRLCSASCCPENAELRSILIALLRPNSLRQVPSFAAALGDVHPRRSPG